MLDDDRPLWHNPVPMAKAAENSTENSADPPVVGKPFVKGTSGNPGGRPKGLARKVRETIGGDGDALVSFWNGVLTGYVPVIARDGTTTYDKVDVSDRIAVSKILAERGWGKPAQFVPIEDDDPLELSDVLADEIAASFDGRLDEIAAQRERRARKTSAAAEA